MKANEVIRQMEENTRVFERQMVDHQQAVLSEMDRLVEEGNYREMLNLFQQSNMEAEQMRQQAQHQDDILVNNWGGGFGF